MGVQGLWTLLSPAGRKLKIQALEGQRLAIDVSIWVIQMINGFSGASKEEFNNAHLIGIFKRLCRLLSLGIKPVFVFDGKAPELKRRTLKKRQLIRENRQVNLKKLAEKYVIRQLEGKIISGATKGGAGASRISNNDDDDDDVGSMNSEEMNGFEKDLAEFQQKIVDLEFKQVLKMLPSHPGLLEGVLSSVEEFQIYDVSSKFAIIQQLLHRISEARARDLSTITTIEEFSIQQSKNFIEYVNAKKEINVERDIQRTSLQLQHQQQLIEEASRSLDPATKDKLLTLESASTNISSGRIASDNQKMFVFMQPNVHQQPATLSSSIGINLQKHRPRKTRYEKSVEIQSRVSELLQHRNYDSRLQMRAAKSAAAEEEEGGEVDHHNNNSRMSDGGAFSDEEEEEEVYLMFAGQTQHQTDKIIRDHQIAVSSSDSDITFDDNEGDTICEGEATGGRSQKIQPPSSTVTANPSAEVDEQLNQGMIQSSGDEGGGDDNLSWGSSSDKQGGKMEIQFSLLGGGDEDEDSLHVSEERSGSSREQRIAAKKKELEEFFLPIKRNSYDILQQKLRESGRLSGGKSEEEEKQEEETSPSNIIQCEEEMPFEAESEVLKALGIQQSVAIVPPASTVDGIQITRFSQEQAVGQDKVESQLQASESDSQSIVRMLDCLDKRAAKKQTPRLEEADSCSQSLRESEKESFKQLISQLSEEQKILSMTNEEAAKYHRERKGRHHQSAAATHSNLMEEESAAAAMNSSSSSDDEFEDVDSVKRLLKQVEKWEEAQSRQVNEDIDLTDEQLELEYQKFHNLSELDADSMRTKFLQVRQLLLLFGVPWVEAPSEAEAQCASLEQIGLVDGIVTDDSDVFLFGGRKVYRGLFARNTDFVRYVDASTIAREFGLSREKLILLSLFLGSDYSLGVKGVGIVNAMEIVSAFESMDALRRFKAWASKADVLMDDLMMHYRGISIKEKNYKDSHKNYKKHWEIDEDFPSEPVLTAYLQPTVDQSEDGFTWGVPNFPLLRAYCATTFNWSPELTEHILKPVVDFHSKPADPQKKITDFYNKAQKFAIINSSRLKNAITGIKEQQSQGGVEIGSGSKDKQRREVQSAVEELAKNAQDKTRKTVKRDMIEVQEEEGGDDEEEDAEQFGQLNRQANGRSGLDSLNRFRDYSAANNKQNSNQVKQRRAGKKKKKNIF